MNERPHETAAGAVVTGIVDLFKKHERIGTLKDDDRIDGKVCLVTGANSGLGEAAAVGLAERGGEVLMACRSGHPDAGERLKRRSGSSRIRMYQLDLSDLASIRSFCGRMEDEALKADIVILNAGVVPKQARRTVQGFEEMFMVNYLANFYLVNTLIAKRIISSGARIIFVSSESHRSAREIDVDGFGEFRDYGMTGSVAEYGYSKLLLTSYAAELARRLSRNGDGRKVTEEDIAVHALCPGPVNTRIAREAPLWIKPVLKLIFAVFFRSPRKAAEPLLYLACSKAIEGETGIYLHLMRRKDISGEAADPEKARRLWRSSEELLAAAGADLGN
jgi:NAD(P)-dependent dehydrogenase (short-subunit alcohol dehydrogenase family)